MDRTPERRPTFIESWIDDIGDDVKSYGAYKLLPWILALCIGFGWCASQLVDHAEFWKRPEVSCVFFTACLTINALLLALSWSSFAKIYEIAGRPEIGRFLKSRGLLSFYIFQVDFIHITQVIAVTFSGLALILSVTPGLAKYPIYFSIDTIYDAAFTMAIASTIYALRYALGAVKIMQDLVWYSSLLPSNGEPPITVHEGGKSAKEKGTS